MSPNEAPLSTHPASQAWFAMLLANDPNTALVAALRPSQRPAFWAALLRPFERPAPQLAALANEPGEQFPGLRPRPARWLGAALLLALALGLTSVGLEQGGLFPAKVSGAFAVLPAEALASTTLSVRPAPSPSAAAPIATSVAPLAPEASAPEEHAAALPPAATAAVPAAAVLADSAEDAKEKPAARRLRRDVRRVLTGRRAARARGSSWKGTERSAQAH